MTLPRPGYYLADGATIQVLAVTPTHIAWGIINPDGTLYPVGGVSVLHQAFAEYGWARPLTPSPLNALTVEDGL